MDTIVLIMFGCLISVTTSLTFIEVRRIRKKLQPK
jgi:hypothetical protein